jgi:hypothetical protein
MTSIAISSGSVELAEKGRQGRATAAREGNYKNRVQFDVSKRSMDRLALLKEKTEASSYAEVVKHALKLYDGLIEETERGSEFLVRDRYGNIAPFKIFV